MKTPLLHSSLKNLDYKLRNRINMATRYSPPSFLSFFLPSPSPSVQSVGRLFGLYQALLKVNLMSAFGQRDWADERSLYHPNGTHIALGLPVCGEGPRKALCCPNLLWRQCPYAVVLSREHCCTQTADPETACDPHSMLELLILMRCERNGKSM